MSRIIAGRAGGHKLVVPTGGRTRPTTDRVREALMSALVSWAGTSAAGAEHGLDGLSVLDLYAGSGAVGLEAASRGAVPVWLVEADRRTAEIARRNARSIGVEAVVRAEKVETLTATSAPRHFDIVFCDPPYDLASSALDQVLLALEANGWVAEDGVVVVERSRRSTAPTWPVAMSQNWDRRYGETDLYFGQRGPSSEGEPR